jgi:hypothetical protein
MLLVQAVKQKLDRLLHELSRMQQSFHLVVFASMPRERVALLAVCAKDCRKQPLTQVKHVSRWHPRSSTSLLSLNHPFSSLRLGGWLPRERVANALPMGSLITGHPGPLHGIRPEVRFMLSQWCKVWHTGAADSLHVTAEQDVQDIQAVLAFTKLSNKDGHTKQR